MEDRENIEIREDSKEDAVESRFDTAQSLQNVEFTSQGFARIPASFSRVGVFSYKSGGRTVREFRPPEEVLRADSIASLLDAPITISHKALVTADNSTLSVGYVRDAERCDDSVGGHVLVQRRDTIDKIKNGELVELSPGYICSIDRTPGEWNGEKYDQVQRNIKYNHVALLPAGKGRQGSTVALRLDEEEENMKEITVRVDGKDFKIKVADETAAFFEQAYQKENMERMDAKEAAEKQAGELEALKEQNAKQQARLDSIEKTELEEKAKRFDANYTAGDKNQKEIKIDILALAGMDRTRFDSASDAYIDGALSTVKFPENAQRKPVSAANLGPSGQTRNDAKEEKTPAQAREARRQKLANQWKVGK